MHGVDQLVWLERFAQNAGEFARIEVVGWLETGVLDAQTYWNNTEPGEPGGTRQVVGAELDLTR